jgi:hypothetical protein
MSGAASYGLSRFYLVMRLVACLVFLGAFLILAIAVVVFPWPQSLLPAALALGWAAFVVLPVLWTLTHEAVAIAVSPHGLDARLLHGKRVAVGWADVSSIQLYRTGFHNAYRGVRIVHRKGELLAFDQLRAFDELVDVVASNVSPGIRVYGRPSWWGASSS